MTEGILADIDDVLADGDKYDNDIKGELKELQHIVSRVKYWERGCLPRWRGCKRTLRYIKLGIPNLLKIMGYDADNIEILVSYYEDDFHETWKIEILIINDPYHNRKFVYDSKIYISKQTTQCFKDVLKKVLVPAIKDIDTFKKFLKKIETLDPTDEITDLNDIL